ncbi:MAG: N-acetylglucosamine kinase [Hyphomicrobiales bacterium]|nr:N-acetylglucosamine kinase [Hyphomicrobiales bacterium]
MAYLIGIDGGGTGCRAVISDARGRVLGRGKAGSANIMTDCSEAVVNIIASSKRACAEAGLPEAILAEASAYLGLAGADIGDGAKLVSVQLPFSQYHIATDTAISLQGAIGDSDGAVAIIGTGSVFVSRSGDVLRKAGGWGFMIGDLGSGAQLGRSLLQETLIAFDGIRSASELTLEVLAKFDNNPRAIVEYVHTAKPGDFGKFAPMVFEFANAGDRTAKKITASAVIDIEETLGALLSNKENQRLCMLGGLAQIYKSALSQRYRDMMIDPLGDAATGAISLAVKMFGPACGGANVSTN